MLLHQQFSLFPVLPVLSPVVLVIYPLIPWVGVMAVGYAFGAFYKLDAQRRRRLFLIIGGVATGLFIVMRAINRLWRSEPVVAAEGRGLHGAFVFEYHEVSAFIVVSVDDAWSIDHRAGNF